MASWVYITTNRKNGTLYVGVTSDLSRRVQEHRTDISRSFVSQHGCSRLVWYGEHTDIRDAIDGEKTIKRWRRVWKIALIEAMNPDWRDLYRGMGW